MRKEIQTGEEGDLRILVRMDICCLPPD